MKHRSPQEIILGVLVLVYISVSVVAYTDFPKEAEQQPLSDLEREGLALWRTNNCQVCHQLYGMGGFLGPDLTNRVTDETPDSEVSWILASGSRQMPAFDLQLAEQEALFAFLRAVNRTGQSLPDPLGADRTVDPMEHFQLLVEAWTTETGRDLEPQTRDGFEVWSRYGCSACHVPLNRGRYRAPDLSRRTFARSPAALEQALTQGRGRMPPFQLTRDDLEALGAYLNWMSGHRNDLVAINDRLLGRHEFSLGSVPWFGYQ